MSRYFVWQGTIVDDAGNAQDSASVEVRNAVTNNLAQLYDDIDGTSALGNPTTTGPEGYAVFYVAAGRYTITASKDDFSCTFENVRIGTLADDLRYERTPAETLASVVPENGQYPPGDVRRYKSGSLVTAGSNDWAAAFQAAIDQCEAGGEEVLVPRTSGIYRCDSALSIAVSAKIRGAGVNVHFYGCSGFDLEAGAIGVTISGLGLFSLSGAGAADPKIHCAINAAGTSGSHCNYITCQDLYLQGWAQCINFEYTWSSVVDNVNTINCDVGVRLFGQSVNNSINNSRLLANTGTASVQTAKDGGRRPEGLMISNTLLAQGDYGLISDGFVGLGITNCIIDLILEAGVDVTNAPGMVLTNNWIYAGNYGVRYRGLGVYVDQEGAIIGNRIETTQANSRPVMIGANNGGLSIIGSTLICGAAGSTRCVYVEATGCDDIAAIGVHLTNPGPNASVFVGIGTFKHHGLTGADTIQYNRPESYAGTLTGIAGTDPTMSIKISFDRDYIDLEIPETLGTSDTTTCTITGMPTGYRPDRRQFVNAVPMSNNGTAMHGRVSIGTDGVITLYNGITSTTFTASGTKGIYACNLRYRRY